MAFAFIKPPLIIFKEKILLLKN